MDHAGETVKTITAFYHTTPVTVRRWKQELGLPVPIYNPRPVEQLTREGKTVGYYDSTYYAAQDVDGSPSNIAVAARNYPRLTAYGFRWRYMD